MSVHMSSIVGFPNESPLAQLTLKWFCGPRGVRPLVQLQIPLGGKALVADQTGERLMTAMIAYVHLEIGSQIHTLTDRTFDVLRHPLLIGEEAFVVGSSDMSGEAGHVDEFLAAVRAGFRFRIVDLLVPC